MAMGLDGSIDDAFKQATSNMGGWLSEDYKLTLSEIAEVLGSAAEYKLAKPPQRRRGAEDQQGPPETLTAP